MSNLANSRGVGKQLDLFLLLLLLCNTSSIDQLRHSQLAPSSFRFHSLISSTSSVFTSILDLVVVVVVAISTMVSCLIILVEVNDSYHMSYCVLVAPAEAASSEYGRIEEGEREGHWLIFNTKNYTTSAPLLEWNAILDLLQLHTVINSPRLTTKNYSTDFNTSNAMRRPVAAL